MPRTNRWSIRAAFFEPPRAYPVRAPSVIAVGALAGAGCVCFNPARQSRPRSEEEGNTMKFLITAAALALTVLAAPAFAASHAASAPMADKKPTAQQNKMGMCNTDAGAKKLEGDARKAFMKDCLSAKPAGDAGKAAVAASPACEKSAADKTLAGAAKTSHIKKCMADSKKG
jgi:psiF repeat